MVAFNEFVQHQSNSSFQHLLSHYHHHQLILLAMAPVLSSTPISITPSASELKHGVLDQRNLEIAIRALSRDGLVVIEDLIDHAILDRLNQKMVADAYELQARKDSPFNYNKGNIQQDPPMTDLWFSDKIYTSE